MNNYQKYKAKFRQEAIEWKQDFANHNYSYAELLYWKEYFTMQGRRYGLMIEFKEKGIL